MATLEQERASFALARIDQIKEAQDKAKYKTQLLKLPARLHSNGLGQTVAFYLSVGQSTKPEWVICNWLQTWLRDQREILPPGQDLIHSLAATDDGAESRYREASAEARALAVWLKRFAEAFIAGEGAEG